MKLLPMVATTVISLTAMRTSPALAEHAAGAAQLRQESLRPGAPGWQQVGEASYYSNRYVGRRTANGERYNPVAMTAAHPWLPLGTRLKVLCEANGRSVVVVVTDRQTANGRVLDLSRRAAETLDIIRSGRARVRLIALSADTTGMDSGPELLPEATLAPAESLQPGRRRSGTSRLHHRRGHLHAATDVRPHRTIGHHRRLSPVT